MTWVKDWQERSASEAQRLDRLYGGGRGRVRRAVEQRQLAEEVARLKAGDDRLIALRRRQNDLHRARRHDVERIAGIVLVKDDLVAPESTSHQGAGDNAQSLRFDMGKQGASPQACDHEFVVRHPYPNLHRWPRRRAPCPPGGVASIQRSSQNLA